MKPRILFCIGILSLFLIICSCGGKDKKENKDSGSTTTKTGSTDGVVPVIDTANLKDETSILAALEKITDAWAADKKRPREGADYVDHSFEIVGIYTAIKGAADRYAASLNMNDPDKAKEFLDKTRVYQKKFLEE